MPDPRFPLTPFTVELAQQLRRGMSPEDLDATAEEIVAAYRLYAAALRRGARFHADMAGVAFDMAEFFRDHPEVGV